MPFNIQNFSAYLGDVGQPPRTNHFMVTMPMPRGLRSFPHAQQLNVTEYNFQYACDSVNFPLTGVFTHGITRYGYGAIEQKPVWPQFGPLRCTFISDSQGWIFDYFAQWIRLVCNFDFNTGIDTDGPPVSSGGTGSSGTGAQRTYELSYKEDYAVDLFLHIFNQQGDQIKLIRFRECYPTHIPDIQYNWGQLDQMVRIPVLFTYFDWHEDEISGVTPGWPSTGGTPGNALPGQGGNTR